MNKIIVLEISGKGDEVDFSKVHLCNSIEEAKAICVEANKKMLEKYWSYAEIIKNGQKYSISRANLELAF